MTNKEVKLKISVDGKEAVFSIDKTSGAVKGLNEETENFSKTSDAAQKNWGKFVHTLNQSFELLERGIGYTKSAFEFLKEGANYTEATQSFSAYAKSLGEDSDKIIESLRKASAGTISNKNLILTASKAMALGVTTDSGQMAKLLEIARSRARVFGIDTTQAFNDVVTGVGRASPQILDNLGIRIPDGFDKLTQGMSAAQKVSKLLELTLEAGGKEIESMGGLILSNADKFRQLTASVEDLNDELKAELAENLIPLVDFAKNTGIPAMKTGLEFINDSIKAIKSLDEQLDVINLTLVATTGAFAGLATAKIIDGFSSLAGAITKAANAQKALNAAALLNPYGVIGVGLAVTTYAGKIKYDEWQAANLEKTNYQSLFESNNPASISRAKIYKLEQELSQFNSLDALEKQKSDLENKLIKAQSALKSARSGYELGGFQKEVTQYNAELEALNAKIEKIEIIKKALVDEKDTLEVINRQQKAIVESQAASASESKVNKENAEKVTELDEKRAKAAEQLVKSYASLNAQFKPLLANESEAYKLLENMTYAAGGLGVNLKNGTTKAGELDDKLSKVDSSIAKAFSGKEFTPADLATGAMDFMTGGLFTAKGSKSADRTIKKTADKINSEFKDAISSSISEGFARADFSAFAESLGSGIKSVVGGALGDTINSLFNKNNMGSLTSGSGLFEQIYTKNSSGNTSLNWAALASNVGIGLGLSFLTSDGGLLGKRKIVGAENINKSTELNAQVDQAKTLRDEMFLALGVSEYTRQLLDEAEFAYTWVTSSKSGSLFNRKKSYTIHNQEAAQSSVKYLEELQAKALDEQAQRSFATFNLGRSDSIQAAAANFTDAQSAYNASQTLLYGGKTKSQIESEISAKNKEATNNYNLYAQFANLSNQFGGNNGSYYKGLSNQYFQAYQNISSEITKLLIALDNPTYKYSLAERTQMQQQLEEAKIALSEAKQTARTGLTSSFLGSATLASLIPQNSGLMNMLLGNSDVANNSSMIKTMLPLLEKAGFQDFDLTKAFADAGNDPQKMLEAYAAQQSILQSASSVYEQLYKDAKAESLNSSLAVEEQMAAFERFQDSFNAFLEIQNQILTNTQTIADIEKQNFSKSLTTDLSDALSVFAETVMQTNGSKTEVYYQTLSASELLAKLKNILKENKTANADALIGAINELEELETWGD